MAIATEVINRLAARGVTFQADSAGGLRVHGASRLTDREKADLKAHKGALLQALASTTATTASEPVTANLAATEPAERACRNCAHFEPYPFEPILGSCYALKRMQNTGSKPARFGCSHFEPKEGRS